MTRAGSDVERAALLELERATRRARLGEFVGTLRAAELATVDDALRVVLGLD